MDWSPPVLWWLAAGVLVALELASGSFYLLMLALGCAAGALAAHSGASGTLQVAVAAVLGALATAAWHFRRASSPRSAPAPFNRDVLLDIGEHVRVAQWHEDGTAQVMYRGASWSVRFAGPGTPQPGEHVIVALHGSQLSVAPAARN